LKLGLRSVLDSDRVSRLAERAFARGRHLAPPMVLERMQRLLSEWERQPAWVDVPAGWNDISVADAQAAHWPLLCRNVEGAGPLGVSHLPAHLTREDWADHNTMMAYGYVLARASRRRSRVSILDWGGGVGHYLLYSKALLPDIAFDYHCYDVPRLCELGRTLLPEAHFHENPAEALDRRYDLVISSSSLHYFRDWRAELRRLVDATGDLLYLARLQTVQHEPSFVAVQRPRRSGYRTSYPSWFFNQQELGAAFAGSTLILVREFVFAEEWLVRGCRERGRSRGCLLRRGQDPPTAPSLHGAP
jgi:putative methyltransferase (TIGR04325 family)